MILCFLNLEYSSSGCRFIRWELFSLNILKLLLYHLITDNTTSLQPVSRIFFHYKYTVISSLVSSNFFFLSWYSVLWRQCIYFCISFDLSRRGFCVPLVWRFVSFLFFSFFNVFSLIPEDFQPFSLQILMLLYSFLIKLF